jgi:hypothetical protein
MSLHRLPTGKHLIAAVSGLGRALGYSVKTEYPVEVRPDAPAVDVAWFRDDENLYPLMIFEVESMATNAMAGNAAKVFGQPLESFERPLFFFHLVVTAGASTRVDALRGTFGSHNYKVYRLDALNVLTELLIDILSQHRRVRGDIDVRRVLTSLSRFADMQLDRIAVIEKAIDLGLRGAYLHTFARSALEGSDNRDLFAELLVRLQTSVVDTGYETYIGQSWHVPIELAILVACGRLAPQEGLDRLRTWQDNGAGLTQIGPHFGLSYEYDEFIFCMAASVWTRVAAIAGTSQAIVRYVADQLVDLLDGMSRAKPGLSFYTAAWTLHVAATGGATEAYEKARRFVNRRGGISEAALIHPPALQWPNDDPEWPTFWLEKARPVPTLAAFRDLRALKTMAGPPDPVTVALRALCDPEHEDECALELVQLLMAGSPEGEQAQEE